MICPVCAVRYPAGTELCARDGVKLLAAAASDTLADGEEASAAAPPLAALSSAGGGAGGDRAARPGAVRTGTQASQPAGSRRSDGTDIGVGGRLGNYTLLRRIGGGETGEVFEAHHEAAGQSVALKRLHPHLARRRQAVKSYFRELRAVDKLAHRGIAAIVELLDATEQTTCVVMELVEGENLDELLQRAGRVSPRRGVEIGVQLCDALAAAHSAGILHLDLKPRHILAGVRPDGSEQLKIFDFGLRRLDDGGRPGSDDPAAAVNDATALHGPATGAATSWSPYRAPELMAAPRQPPDVRADIFSIGAVLYHALSGRPPFEPPLPGGERIHEARRPAPMSSLTGEVPVALNDVLICCLAPSPSARFSDLSSLRAALFAALGNQAAPGASAAALGTLGSSLPPGAVISAAPTMLRRLLTIGAAAAITLLAVIGALSLVEWLTGRPLLSPALVVTEERIHQWGPGSGAGVAGDAPGGAAGAGSGEEETAGRVGAEPPEADDAAESDGGPLRADRTDESAPEAAPASPGSRPPTAAPAAAGGLATPSPLPSSKRTTSAGSRSVRAGARGPDGDSPPAAGTQKSESPDLRRGGQTAAAQKKKAAGAPAAEHPTPSVTPGPAKVMGAKKIAPDHVKDPFGD